MKKPLNIKEAEELIKKYREITLKEIDDYESIDLIADEIATELTGIGSTSNCTLCKKVKVDCSRCIYYEKNSEKANCIANNNEDTYEYILNVIEPNDLLKAFKDRANHIEKLLKRNKWKS